MRNVIIYEPTPGGVEKAYDIFSRLLKERIIFVGEYEGIITTDAANLLIAQLLYLDAQDTEKDINLYINSPGGSVPAALAIYDTLQFIRSPVTTICIGKAMSAGALLLTSGNKGKRFALPNARLMIHQPLIAGEGLTGSATDIDIEARELIHAKNRLIDILVKHTGQPVDKIRQDTERNFYMSAEEAKNYGLIDEVILTRK